MSAYFLDTSVAGLILDGELHSREPHLLPRYMSELGFSCSSTSDIVSHPSVQRVVAAFEWSKAFRARGGRLLITPTVRVELDCAPQVNCRIAYYIIHVCSSLFFVTVFFLQGDHTLVCCFFFSISSAREWTG